MVSKIIPIPPFDCIVFGGAGDLAERKLFPALYHRQCSGQFSEPTRIIGTSRSKLTDEEYRNFARQAIEKHVSAADIDKGEVDRFLKRLSYVPVDATTDDGWDKLKKAIEIPSASTIRAFYLAVSPALFGSIAEHLGKNGLVTPTKPALSSKNRLDGIVKQQPSLTIHWRGFFTRTRFSESTIILARKLSRI